MAEVLGPGITYLTRSAWGARTDLPRLGYPVARGRRTHIIVHHTVIIDDDATPDLWENLTEVIAKMRQLQTIRPKLGLDVPYNFVIFLMADGTIVVCEGRGIALTGAHTHGHNTDGIGTALQGNFELLINVAPYVPLISRFLGWLKYDQRLESLGRIDGHSDFSSTACPGSNLYKVLGQMTYAWKEDDMALDRNKDWNEFVHMMHRFVREVPAQARHAGKVLDDGSYQLGKTHGTRRRIGDYLGIIRDNEAGLKAHKGDAAKHAGGGSVNETRARQIADEQDAKLKHR